MFWRHLPLYDYLPQIDQPETHITDPLLLKNICQNRNLIPASPQICLSSFDPHKEEAFLNFIDEINRLFGRKIYITFPELCYLGIVLNVEVGFLVHVHSLRDPTENFSFCNTKSLNKVIEKIVNGCNTKINKREEVKLIKRFIKLLYKEHYPIAIPKVQYNVSVCEEKPFVGESYENVRPYTFANPLLPLYQTFKCDICLKSFESRRSTILHVNAHHKDALIKKNTSSYVSLSYSQMSYNGLITVMTSARFEISEYLIKQNKLCLTVFTEDELCVQLQKLQKEKYYKDFTVNRVSGNDDMFKHNYVIKFVNALQHDSLVFYKDYIMMNAQLQCIYSTLSSLISMQFISFTEKYKYSRDLRVHKSQCLKFFLSSARRSSFIFTKISNKQTIKEYANISAKALVTLMAGLNLHQQESLQVLNFEPAYKIEFEEDQIKLLERIFRFCQKIAEQQTCDNKVLLDSSTEQFAIFFSDLRSLMISIALQDSSERTPLQAIFTFDIFSYDCCARNLEFFRPRKRMSIFKALLYFIRCSILSEVKTENDEHMLSQIELATKSGELRKLMERMYYPTTYYFLGNRKLDLQPFFNPEKYMYLHPVSIEGRTIGFKALGLYSVRLMVDRIEELLCLELKYVKGLIFTNKQREKTLKRNHNEDLRDRALDIENSISVITTLLIGYLIISNPPLENFSEYMSFRTDSLKHFPCKMMFDTDHKSFFINESSFMNIFCEYIKLKKSIDSYENDTYSKDLFFLSHKYVRAKTFIDLVSCKYTDFYNLYKFLKEAQEQCRRESGNMGDNTLNWLRLVRSKERILTEGYLVVNPEKFAMDYRKFALSEDYKDTVDSQNLISCDDDLNLNLLLDNGFLDSYIDDFENLESPDISDNEDADITFDFNEYSEMDITLNSEEYLDLVKEIKLKTKHSFPQKKLKSVSFSSP